MKSLIRNLCHLMMICSLLSSCAMPAAGEKFDKNKLNTSQAQLIVYREAQFSNKGVIFYIEADDKPIGNLRDGGYVKANLLPGSHIITLKIKGLLTKKQALISQRFRVHPGQNTFVKIDNGNRVNPLVTGLGIASAAVTGIGFTEIDSHYALIEVSRAAAIKQLSLLRASF